MRETIHALKLNKKQVKYKFFDRRKSLYSKELFEEIGKQIDFLCDVSIKPSESLFLYKNGVGLSTNDLCGDRPFKRDNINLYHYNNEINLEVCGEWGDTILYEVPLLAIINECKARVGEEWDIIQNESVYRLNEKIKRFRHPSVPRINFCEFGTRRRSSGEFQRYVVEELKNVHNFVGSSNVMFCKDYRLKPIGTMAHEYLQAFQRISENLIDFQYDALRNWADINANSVALSDIVGDGAFVYDFFKRGLYKYYSGVRHDSGSPFDWAELMIQQMNLVNKDLKLVFSDSLDFKKCIELENQINGRAETLYAIGTFLTHDCVIPKPNTVIKMIEFDGGPVAKISNEPGKSIGDSKFVSKLKNTFNI